MCFGGSLPLCHSGCPEEEEISWDKVLKEKFLFLANLGCLISSQDIKGGAVNLFARSGSTGCEPHGLSQQRYKAWATCRNWAVTDPGSAGISAADWQYTVSKCVTCFPLPNSLLYSFGKIMCLLNWGCCLCKPIVVIWNWGLMPRPL